MKKINYVDYVWFSEDDKKSLIELYNKEEDFKSLFIDIDDGYELFKDDLGLFVDNKCNKEEFTNLANSLANEYSVLIKDGVVSFVSIDYTIKSTHIYSNFIVDCGRFYLEFEKVSDELLEFTVKNKKGESSGLIFMGSEEFIVYVNEEKELKQIDRITINLIKTIFSEIIKQ